MAFCNVTLAPANVGTVPEMKTSKNGADYATFRVAVGGRGQDRTGQAWFTVVAFGNQAKFVVDHVEKGAKILVSGDFNPRDYQAADGTNRTSLDIAVREIQLLSPPRERQAEESTTDEVPF